MCCFRKTSKPMTIMVPTVSHRRNWRTDTGTLPPKADHATNIALEGKGIYGGYAEKCG